VLQRTLDGEAKEKTPAKRGWSIAAYLVVLALASTVPIAIVAGVLGYRLLSASSERTRLDLDERLALLRGAVELRIDNVVEDLEVLGRSPALQDGNLAEFRRHAVQTVDLIGGSGLVLVDRAGQEIMSTRLPPGAPLPRRRDMETQNRVFATGKPQVSDLLLAEAERRTIISIEVPVRISGELRYVLSIGLSPEYLSELMDRIVPQDMIGSIADRKGILIARRPLIGGEDLIGKPVIPEVRAHIGEPSASWIATVSRSGVPNYSSLLRSEQTGWSVNLALPRAVVDEPLRQALMLYGGLAVIAFLLSWIFARLVAACMLRALTGLEQHVEQLGRGRPIEPAPSPVAEVNRMEEVLRRVSHDIAAAKDAVERERSLLRATVEAMPIGVLLVTPDGAVSLVNRKMLALWGFEALRSLDDLKVLARFHPDGTPYPATDWPIIRALKGGRVSEDEEIVHQTADGRRCIMVNAAPIRDAEGRIIAAVAASYDVTEIRSAMTRQQLLLDEINHRVKNTLATVQSVARLTLSSSDTLQDYANAFERRLLALSAAYNLLTENNWEGAELKAIVDRTLAPFAGAGRTSVSGPVVMLSAKYTLALAAAIQELSTNAAKYGALSTRAGSVDVAWSQQNDGRVLFRWVEQDGPAVATPSRRGFGTKLIQDILANETGWTATLDYLPTGLRCTMIIDPGSKGRKR
jgi:PAS domain S-box-containing protein